MAARKGPPQAPAEPDADDMGDAGPKDFMGALEELPDEVSAPEGDSGLDAEQTALAEEMGMTTAEAGALKRFIETCHGKAY